METANPENAINLLTDVTVCANNRDDSVILTERLEKIVEKTPELNELHTDGGYGSSANDVLMENAGIVHVQTAVRGREAAVPIVIDRTDHETYTVACPCQTVESEPTRTRFKATFAEAACALCVHARHCPAVQQRAGRVYYFDEEMARQNQRVRAITHIPTERRRLRPNVEATVKEFTIPFNHKGKLRVRGLFKTMVYAFSRAIAVNFGRIVRLLWDTPAFWAFFVLFYAVWRVGTGLAYCWERAIAVKGHRYRWSNRDFPFGGHCEQWAF
jgi:hypothetical protein